MSVDPRARYLNLLEKCVLGQIYHDPPNDFWSSGGYHEDVRRIGGDWPSQAHSMIGYERLHSLRVMCEIVLEEGIPGDFMECGVWRGGALVLMRGVLVAHDDLDRVVWGADSFQGLPEADPRYPGGAEVHLHRYSQLAVSQAEVGANLAAYGLLDDRVRLLAGWFRDTLPTAPVERLAILRLDGDLYESTQDALNGLYDKVSLGGYVIIDDYGGITACRQAVTDYRAARGITEPIARIDWTGAYWRKLEGTSPE